MNLEPSLTKASLALAAVSYCVIGSSCDLSQSQPAAGALESRVAQVEIGPSVLHVGQDHFTLTWTTKGQRSCMAHLVGPGGTPQEFVTPPSRHHKLEFEDLESGTTYVYEVDGRFRGEVETDDDGTFQSFAVFGHPGGTKSAGTFPFGTVASALEDATVDYALCTGDACYFTTEDSFKQNFFSPFQRILRTRPIYLTAANHDAGLPAFEGTKFSVYRQLFPYDFPAKVTPFYSFTRGDIEFFACAYGPLARGEGEKQLKWLAEGLAASRAEFRIVFLGDGQSLTGFDRAAFFEVAAAGGVDIVFGGDGSGVRKNEDDGVPYFFAGSGGRAPHFMFLVEQRDYELNLRLFSSLLKPLGPPKTFQSHRPKTQLEDLLPRLEVLSKGASPKYSRCQVNGLDLEGKTVNGVEIVVTNPYDARTTIGLEWSAAGTKREGFYREIYRVLQPNESSTLQFAIPAVTPRGGLPVVLNGVRITMTTKDDIEGFNILDHLEACSVFADPLAGSQAGR